MSPRLALIALLTLPLTACEGVNLPGMESGETAPAEGHQGPPGVSPLEQPIETGAEAPRAVSTAEATTLNTNAFSARGNEPFWAVDAAGQTAIYKTPDNQSGRAVRVNRITFAEGVEYVGVVGGRPFVLTIRGKACRDDMSGAKFPMTATLKVSGRSNNGCAAAATAEVASAVAATRAPAPAAPRTTRRAAPAATRPAASPAAATSTAATATTEATATQDDVTTAPVTGSDSPTPAATETSPPAALPAPAIVLPETPPAVTDDAADAADTPESADSPE